MIKIILERQKKKNNKKDLKTTLGFIKYKFSVSFLEEDLNKGGEKYMFPCCDSNPLTRGSNTRSCCQFRKRVIKLFCSSFANKG